MERQREKSTDAKRGQTVKDNQGEITEDKEAEMTYRDKGE